MANLLNVFSSTKVGTGLRRFDSMSWNFLTLWSCPNSILSKSCNSLIMECFIRNGWVVQSLVPSRIVTTYLPTYHPYVRRHGDWILLQKVGASGWVEAAWQYGVEKIPQTATTAENLGYGSRSPVSIRQLQPALELLDLLTLNSPTQIGGSLCCMLLIAVNALPAPNCPPHQPTPFSFKPST